MVAPPETVKDPTGSATMSAPRRCNHSCTSPTSQYSLINKDSKSPFSENQREVIIDVLTEASDLLGDDAGQLTISPADAARLRLPTSTTYTEAIADAIARGDRRLARDVTKAILLLRGRLQIDLARIIRV
jgi:hypothetical protein